MYTIKKGGMIMKLSNMRMSGFTLAEVLITLGIIGVVAAMTMPTLMNSTQGAQYKAAYKKALSAIAQGVTLNVALDGSSFADAVAGPAGEVTAPTGGESVASILNSRMNIVNATNATDSGYGMTTPQGGGNATSNFNGKVTACVDHDSNPVTPCQDQSVTPDTFLFFNDGSMFAYVAADAVECTDDEVAGVKHCSGVIDVNGLKGPNKIVKCDDGNENVTTGTCTVSNPTDIYPVEFYDQTILPASDAAKAVLYGK